MLADIIVRLLKLLEASNTAIVSPWTIGQLDPTLYRRLIEYLPKLPHGLKDWTVVIRSLPPELRQKWKLERTPEIQPDDLIELEQKLTQYDPPTFGPTWILEYVGSAFYQRILRRMGQIRGRPNWEKLVALLPATWKKKWSDRNIQQRHRNRTELVREVEQVLDKYKDKLYVLFFTETTEDQKLREKIARSLLSLARQGNLEARNKLWDLLRPMIDSWITNRSGFAIYQKERLTPKELFEKSINSYKINKGPYIRYLYLLLSTTATELLQKERK